MALNPITGLPWTLSDIFAYQWGYEVTGQSGTLRYKTLSVSVDYTDPALPVTITPTTLADGTQYAAYSQQFTASGGDGGPYTFALQSGTLPTGVTLTSGGLLAGTPTNSGVFSFTVRATDASATTGDQAYTLTVSAAAAVTITPTSLSAGTTGVAYSQQLTGHGGDAGPYTFAVHSGTLPAGLTLSTGGLLSGTPTAGASISPSSLPGATVDVTYSQQLSVVPNVVSTFTVRATDGSANTGDQAYTLTVDARTAPYTYELVEDLGELPTCMTCSVLGLIAGTPYCVGVWTITVRATDALGVTTDRAYTFTATS